MFLFLANLVAGTVYFEENFDDDDWEQRWVYSKYRPTRGDSKIGKFRLTSGAYYGNQRVQKGIQTMDEVAWYQITSKLKNSFNSTGKDLILQYTIRFENGFEKSGGYLKLLGPDTKPIKFNQDSPYYIMFGPDVCKDKAHKLMFLVTRNGTNYDNQKYMDSFYDELTHAYTLIIFANRTYEVRMDGKSVESGNLEEDFELGGAHLIADPDDVMPDDWYNRELIPDPDDTKPDDWEDDQIIPDPTIKQPPEWREHVDGVWTPPMIINPRYKGPWKPRMIANPDYKGEWTPRMIPNPVSVHDPGFAVFEDISYVGIEIYQDTPGSIYDNILLTDDLEYAEKRLNETFLQYKNAELAMYKRVLQDKAAEEELRKLQEKENQADTDTDFMSSRSSSSSSSDDDDDVLEPDENFQFDFKEPDPSTFEFPYDVDFNEYFIEKKKWKLRISNRKSREDYSKKIEENRNFEEMPEDFAL